MAKIKAPLFSLDASGTLDKTITYRNKPQNKTASKYAKPGDVNPFESSPRQKDQRSIIGLITACWQSKTNLDKLSWDASAKAARFKGSGYHYFLHLAQSDLTTYLGLVGFWSMNYNIGDKVPDLSGNGNHGTLMPVYPCDCPQPVASNNKKNGKAYIFDGIDDYINCGNNASLQLTEFTLFASYYHTALPLNRPLLSKVLSSLNRNYQLWILNTSSPYFEMTQSSIHIYRSFSTLGFTLNSWNQLAFTFKSPKWIFYLNGMKEEYNLAVIPDQALLSNLLFMTRPYGTTAYLPGKLDNALIYNRSLIASEIQRLNSLFI